MTRWYLKCGICARENGSALDTNSGELGVFIFTHILTIPLLFLILLFMLRLRYRLGQNNVPLSGIQGQLPPDTVGCTANLTWVGVSPGAHSGFSQGEGPSRIFFLEMVAIRVRKMNLT